MENEGPDQIARESDIEGEGVTKTLSYQSFWLRLGFHKEVHADGPRRKFRNLTTLWSSKESLSLNRRHSDISNRIKKQTKFYKY